MCSNSARETSWIMANLLHLVQSIQLAEDPAKHHSRRIRSCLGWRLEDQCSRWTVAHTANSFTKRVTAIRWHPIHPDTVAFGTHGGFILLWKFTKPAIECPEIEGTGVGHGCITEMRFHPYQQHLIYTTAVDSRFCLQDFSGRESQVILNTPDIDHWWCALDVSVEHGIIVVGDNYGTLVLLDLETNSYIRRFEKLHKGKIKYAEFCPARTWMLVTASVDRTIKFWDIRMLRSCPIETKPKPLSILEHSALVSSAYFDPISGLRLLTTSQNGEIRVYDSHDLWEHPTAIISHPHRNFQHMTDIKATWHPLYEDLCVVGRYPRKDDPDQSRTIDLINVKTGQKSGCFYDPRLKGIIQLNQFNKMGDSLASGMGYNGLIWKLGGDKWTEKVDSDSSVRGLLHVGDGVVRQKRNRSERKDEKQTAKKKENYSSM